MRNDRYDIEAKADKPLKSSELPEAVRALLEERFQLKSHQERRELPGIVLRAPRTGVTLKQAGPEEKYSMRMESGNLVFAAAPMSALANYLSNLLTAPVLDDTELNGVYDFKLTIPRLESRSGTVWEDRVRAAVEAMGLRLENRRIPVDVTVVDHCERPSAN